MACFSAFYVAPVPYFTYSEVSLARTRAAAAKAAAENAKAAAEAAVAAAARAAGRAKAAQEIADIRASKLQKDLDEVAKANARLFKQTFYPNL